MLFPKSMRCTCLVLSLCLIASCSKIPIRTPLSELDSIPSTQLNEISHLSVKYHVKAADRNSFTGVRQNYSGKTFYVYDGIEFYRAVKKVMPAYFPSAQEESEDNIQNKAHLYYYLTSEMEIDGETGRYDAIVRGFVGSGRGDILYQGKAKAFSKNTYINNTSAAYNAHLKAVNTFVKNSIDSIGLSTLVLQDKGEGLKSARNRNDIRSGSGSGFFVNASGYLMTAAHVINDCSSIDIHRKGRVINNEPVEIVAQNSFLDLAILKSDQGGSVYAQFADSNNLTLGEEVWSFGYPLGDLTYNSLRMSKGEISSDRGYGKGSEYLQFTAPINSGNSGGPILSRYGLAGVTLAAINKEKLASLSGAVVQENLNFGMISDAAKLFMDRHNIKYSEQKTYSSNDKKLINQAKSYVVQISCY